MAAFRDYQLNNAWTWEHQALVRTRVVVGSESMRTQFNDIRIHVLQQGVSTESLKADVVEMRSRMRRELDRSSEANFDLKQGHGGIADIEFVVQYSVLSTPESSANYWILLTMCAGSKGWPGVAVHCWQQFIDVNRHPGCSRGRRTDLETTYVHGR